MLLGRVICSYKLKYLTNRISECFVNEAFRERRKKKAQKNQNAFSNVRTNYKAARNLKSLK